MSQVTYGPHLPIAYMGEIFLADQTRNVVNVISAIWRCVTEHHISLQQIETTLRQNNCWTYIIARWPNRSGNKYPCLTPLLENGPFPHYYLFVSTRAPEEAMKEVCQHSSTYEENFAKLPLTGQIVLVKGMPLEQQVDPQDVDLFPNAHIHM